MDKPKLCQKLCSPSCQKFLCSLCLACIYSLAVSQTFTSHKVSIRLPQLLSIKSNSPQLLEPSGATTHLFITDHHLAIRTNGRWELSANFALCNIQSTDLSLRVGREGVWQRLRSYPRVLLTGLATSGWKPIFVDGQLEPPVTDTACQITLFYSLVQP